MSDRPVTARAARKPDGPVAARAPRASLDVSRSIPQPAAPFVESTLIALQRAAGNRAVGDLLATRPPGLGGTSGGSLGRTPGRAPTGAPASVPTIQRLSADQATSIARKLHDAMDRWGTDEEAIYGALSGRSKADLDAITAAYQPMAMKGSLDADLRDELNDSEMARVRSLLATAAADAAATTPDEQAKARSGRARDVARQLDEAMRGLGTDEEQLINSLMGRSPYDVVEIAREYHGQTGKVLVDEIRSELSGADLRTALGLFRTMHAQGDGPNEEIGHLQQALNANGASPAVRITAVFGPETTTALRAFQAAHPPLTSNGQATVETWLKLDQLTPEVFQQGVLVRENATPGDARGVPASGTVHPTVSFSKKGAAVEELQQKLLTIAATVVPTRPTASGTFDAKTRSAVREFQGAQTPPMTKTGIADKATWAALDAAAGPVTVGREEFEWGERTEGTDFGGHSNFTWRLHPDRFEVTVNIKFKLAPNHPRVAAWKQDITSTWNRFKLVDDDHPGTELPMRFVVGSGTPADATINVKVQPASTKPEDIGRSDAGNWFTLDLDKGLAPHEFGHLIGLRDEYNQGHGDYSTVTGEQPDIGQLQAFDSTGAVADPATVATELRTAVTSNPKKDRGTKALAVIGKYKMRQGAFSQRVAQAYETANAGNLLAERWVAGKGLQIATDATATCADDLAARIDDPKREPAVVRRFLHSNRSLMGEMQSLNTPVNKHDHPIAVRHVRHFADLVRKNKPGNWRIVEL
jgi:peptidoglycan hydrolase-like protein with peptidoglycan-binding domain